MEITIDPGVTFKLSGGRVAVVDAEELADFSRKLWAEKGIPNPDPAKPPTMPYDVLVEGVTLFFKTAAGVDLKPSEARQIGELHLTEPWEQKKRSWAKPSETTPAPAASLAPGGRDPSDPRYMPDPDDLPIAPVKAA